MKKFILTLIFVTIVMAATIIYEKYFIASEFGPSAMLAVLLLACFASALIITLLVHETRFHELVTRIWLVLISMGVTFLVADLLVGYFLIKPLSPELSPDKIRHHKLVANTYSRFEQLDFSYIQRVNNIGLRGKETILEKPANYYRIIMLGDSFTMGKGVEDDETFSALLNDSLNKEKKCESTTIEVLNGGTDSYAPILSYLQLSNDLAPLDPDVVFLNLDISDLVQETAYNKEAVRDADGEIVAVPGSKRAESFNLRVRRWIDQNLFFTRLMLFYTNKLLGHKDLTIQGVVTRANSEIVKYTLTKDKENRDEQWDRIFRSLSKIKQFTDERSISFVLVIYPWGHQVNDKEWVPGRYVFMSEDDTYSDKYLDAISRRAEAAGIELVNLFPLFRSYEAEEPLYFKHDMHMTTEGNKVMATGIKQFLIDNYSAAWCN